ncbi:MAG: MerR family transcriptional regulator [bacterium]|nr:MerR family transcriptional regulator [bacterium]
MLAIGELSRITQLSVKALRIYHEKGILVPDKIDGQSKYRYYSGEAVQKALTIRLLRDMGFSLDEIKTIVTECTDEKQLAKYLKGKIKEIDGSIREFKARQESLSILLKSTKSRRAEYPEEVQEKVIPDIYICSVRFKGRYVDVGRYFNLLFRKFGRFSRGAFSLYYDGEYKEEGADIEACVEVEKRPEFEKLIEEIILDANVNAGYRLLKGGKVLTLVHKGPYEELHRSYTKLYEEFRSRKLELKLPVRECYIKGPGFIFRGNPKKYLTELILPYE